MDRAEIPRKAIKYVMDRPGQSLHYVDIAEDLHIAKGQVNAALNRVYNKHPDYGIQRVGAGRFMYRKDWSAAHLDEAKPKETDALYEKVGTIQGRTIIRDENNELWQLVPVKLAE